MTETPQQQDTRPGTGFDRDGLRSFDRLRRSTTDRKIAGVAGGLGRHLNMDPTVLRVLFVVLVFFGGAGLLLYGAAWLLVPEEGSDDAAISTTPSTRNTLLIVAGVLAALLLIGDSWGGFGFPWPLAVIALVVVLVMVNRDRPRTPSAGPTGPAGTGDAPMEGVGAPWGASDTTQAYAGSGYDDQPGGPPSGPASWAPAYTPPPAPRPAKQDRGPRLFGVTLALIALALGVLGLADVAGVPVADAAYPALALAVVGGMLVLGSVAGRPGGLILLGIVAALALAVTNAAGEYGWDDPDPRSFTPLSGAGLPQSYDFFAGSTTVDLTQIDDLEELDGRTLDLRAEAGEIVVIVPQGLDVEVDARIGVGGEIEVDGLRREGGSPSLVTTIDGGDDVPELSIDIDLTVGTIDVRQEEAA